MQRKKGDGSFRRLPNNSFEFAISVGNDIYGSRQRKFFYGKTESECRKKYKEFMKGGDIKPQINTKEHTLSVWLSEWLQIYKQKKVQSSTYDEYVYLASIIERHKIGKMKLSQVKPLHVTDFFTSIIEYSHSVRKKMRFLINAAFECAIDNDICSKNPVRRAEIARKQQPEKEAYSEREVQTIINFAKTDKLFGLAVYIMLNTGIRSGEMRALTTDRIDFENSIITIDRAVKDTGELGKPKNGRTRYIPLEPEVAEFLKAKIGENVYYIVGDSNYVTQAGFRSRYNKFFARLNKALANLGAEPILKKSPHSMRHTYGTLLQKHGMPIAIVSELLGHHSTDVTDKYTHLNDVSVLSQAVEKYDLVV